MHFDRFRLIGMPGDALKSLQMTRVKWLLARVLMIAAAALAGATGLNIPKARAENADIAARRISERLSFSDEEIAGGFFKVAFGAELQFGQHAERIRKFDEPVRVFVDNRESPGRSADIAAIIADIRSRVAHLDMAVTNEREAANMIVTIVKKRDLGRTLRARFGREKAKKLANSLTPVCLSGISKDATYRIRHAEVFLPADVSDFTFYDCAYEELLQASGPINDTASVPWTMFNDGVQMGFFDRYDQYLLNILYDPRIAPGMTREEVEGLLPDILPAVRRRVGQENRDSSLAQVSKAEVTVSR